MWQPKPAQTEYQDTHFAQIASSFTRDHMLSGEAKVIGLLFVDHADRKGETYVSMGYLRRQTGFSEAVIERERAVLVRRCFLKKWAIRGKDGQYEGWRYKTTEKLRFRLNPENRGSGFRDAGKTDTRFSGATEE